MKDGRGNVIVKGWADDVEPLGENELKALGEAPRYDEELKKQAGTNQTKETPKKSKAEKKDAKKTAKAEVSLKK